MNYQSEFNSFNLPSGTPDSSTGSTGEEVILPTKNFSGDERGSVSWTSSSVIEWIESLASATEAKEQSNRSSNHGGTLGMTKDPLSIGDVVLCQPSQIPPTAPWAKTNPVLPLASCFGNQDSILATPKYWDLSYQYHFDPHGSALLREIMYQAVKWETIATETCLEDSFHHHYKSLQTRMEYLVERFLFQHNCPHNNSATSPEVCSCHEAREQLDQLYKDTILKLQQLIASVPRMDGLNGISPSPSFSSPPTCPQKELSPFMNEWLRKNWTNPYPDDEVLAELAEELGTMPVIVSNWLINARTRKWRPALQEAIKMQRPAHNLLQDSLDIFSGGEPSAKRSKFN